MSNQIKDRREVPAEELSKLVIAYCDPLFLSDSRNSFQKNKDKSNGTITYIQYKGQLWGITNSHVSEKENSQKKLTLCGLITQPIHLAEANTHGGFRSLRANGDITKPDIAIIKICETVKQAHFTPNSKKAINLDEWILPHNETISTPVAFGFPTDHKTDDGGLTLSPFVLVTGDLSGNWTPYHGTFSFHASLSKDCDFFLSGMSGGPIFHAEDRENSPLVIGIVYEGSPGADRPSGIFGRNDAMIFGHTLTPEIFDGWLCEVGF